MAKSMPAKGGRGAGSTTSEDRKNAPSKEDITDIFDDLHSLKDELEEATGRIGAKMKEVFDRATTETGLTKTVLKERFSLERAQRKLDIRMAKTDAADRDGFRLLTQIFGDNSPMGEWAAAMAKKAGPQTTE